MKREGKSGEGEAEKEENLGEKLRRGALLVGKRGGPSTPVHSWRLWAPLPPSTLAAHDTIINNRDYFPFSHSLPSPSARKLAAALWEFQHYFPLSKMHRGVSNGGGGGADSRLRRHPHHHYKLSKDKGLDLSNFLADNSPSSPEQPGSASSLRRHVAASLMQHHRLIERNNRALQPVSPASYGSSMEVAHYNPAVTPTSSLDFKGRIGGSNYNLKTSTELLKVLNRIWSLEEQHASNISMIKALKMELDQSRLKIKELLRDRQAGRHEMDDLMKQMAEDKLVRKSKEQERIHAAVQSVRDELEDERKLRKRSESLHRKLARDFSEVKSSLSNALKELESERKSRILLEELCDEFAGGIKDYEQEVHALKQKSDKDWAGGADRDRLILHISESWLDERMQMQLEEAQCGFAGKNSMVDKLSLEIETFLQTKRMDNSKNTDNQLLRDRRKSLESVPLNEALSAPQDMGDEEDSVGSDSHCFELKKPSNNDFKSHVDEALDNHIDEAVKSNDMKKKLVSHERVKNRTPSNLQVKFDEQMSWAMSCNGNKKPQVVETEQGKTTEGKPIDISTFQMSGQCEANEDSSYQNRSKHNEIHGSNSSYMVDSLIRSQFSLSDGVNINPDSNFGSVVDQRMPENKPVIGLSWEPKLPNLSSRTHDGSESKSQNQGETSALWRPNSELVDGLFVPPNDPRKLNKFKKKQLKDTAGKGWFDMPAQTITPEIEKDLRLLKLRSAIDPKRHYKKGDSKSKTLPKYFQIGTVVESASDFFTGRLKNKERKGTIAAELLSDRTLADYRKRKVREIEEKNQPGGNEKWKIKGRQSLKRAKQRRH